MSLVGRSAIIGLISVFASSCNQNSQEYYNETENGLTYRLTNDSIKIVFIEVANGPDNLKINMRESDISSRNFWLSKPKTISFQAELEKDSVDTAIENLLESGKLPTLESLR